MDILLFGTLMCAAAIAIVLSLLIYRKRKARKAAPAYQAHRADRRSLREDTLSALSGYAFYEDAAPGSLVENIPRHMRSQIPSNVEVRIGRSEARLLALGLHGQAHKHPVLTTKAMTVSLQAPKGGFAIQPLSRETQWVDGSQQQRLGLLSLPEYGRWQWIVTPLRRGTHPLHIVAAAKSCDENGVEAETPMPQEVIEVLVSVNYKRTALELGQWLAVGAAGGLVAEYAPRLLGVSN